MSNATNPYRIEGPALISFSGGRTSAYMLHEIISAHDGTLPDDVKVAFANTGKEREETLRFVHECGSRWGVNIHWLEWRDTKPCFEEVSHNSASRNGEPFDALIAKKKRLPNWQERWCTEFLKVRAITAYAETLGWRTGAYAEVIGLRNDEGHRIIRALHNANFKRDKKTKTEIPRIPARVVRFPLASAKRTKADVMAFWSAQPFDLGLEPWEGNCDVCFMKGRGIRKRIIRNTPRVAIWWNGHEQRLGGFFDRRDRVQDLIEEVYQTPELFDELDDFEYDTECGLLCGAA
jgi:3'-phosphoadenosine 5'-phosphosulfate sulfotransferase (PAPS reductase)/FAD synthetase